MPDISYKIDTPLRCFVIMGFGIKIDFATGRKLDLNKSFKYLIKPVVESKGLICIRADEIQHSGSIDYQMYKELLEADIVIADLSTSNVNAFYELGIRHALRRRTTIVISEDKMTYPFDLSHINITHYTHLGEAIDYGEVERFRKVLGDTIDAVLKAKDTDSPLYSSLQELNPPYLESAGHPSLEQSFRIRKKMKLSKKTKGIAEKVYPELAMDIPPSLSSLAEQGEEALQSRKYADAKVLFTAAVELLKGDAGNNPYLVQRLAYATYKTKLPDVVSALYNAIDLLSQLDLSHTNDTETVSLAGRIEKKLHHNGQGDEHLARAIEYYQRGYYLLQNRYHGINLAFLLNKRVDSSLSDTEQDKIADMIWANRIRQEVIEMCNRDWMEITSRKDHKEIISMLANFDKPADYNLTDTSEQMYWILVNKAEAHYGRGEMHDYSIALAKANEINPTEWMRKSFQGQHDQLRELLLKYGHLLNPAWREEA